MSLGKQIFLRIVVASLTTTGVLAIGTLLFGSFDETAGRILATTGILAFFSLLSLPAGILLDEDRHRSLAVLTLSLAGLGFLVAMTLVWGNWEDGDESGWRLLAAVTAFAGACSQVAATTARLRPGDSDTVTRLYWFSSAAGFVLAAMVSLAVWNEIDDGGYYRLLGALAVANVVAVLLQPTLRRMAPEQAAAPAPAAPEAPADKLPRLVIAVDKLPPREAVEEVVAALVRHGSRVESVERQG